METQAISSIVSWRTDDAVQCGRPLQLLLWFLKIFSTHILLNNNLILSSSLLVVEYLYLSCLTVITCCFIVDCPSFPILIDHLCLIWEKARTTGPCSVPTLPFLIRIPGLPMLLATWTWKEEGASDPLCPETEDLCCGASRGRCAFCPGPHWSPLVPLPCASPGQASWWRVVAEEVGGVTWIPCGFSL